MEVNYIEATHNFKSAFEIIKNRIGEIENRLEEVDSYNEEHSNLFDIQSDLGRVELFLNRIIAHKQFRFKFNMKSDEFVLLVESVLNKINQMDSSDEGITYLDNIKANLEKVKSFLHDYWQSQN